MSRYSIFSVAILAILLLGNGSGSHLASVYETSAFTQWDGPSRVPATEDLTSTPWLVADSENNVNLFFTQVVHGVDGVYFTRWLGSQWLEPAQIILPPIEGGVRDPQAVIDSQGNLSMILSAGNEQDSRLYFTRAHISQAHKASGWTEPREITSGVDPSLKGTALVRLPSGELLAIYGGHLSQPALYAISSVDGGEKWSAPQALFLIPLPVDQQIAVLSVVVGPDSTAHVVWSMWSDKGYGLAVMYTARDPQNNRWRAPMQLAVRDEGDYEADWPSVVAMPGGKVFVAYQDGPLALHFGVQSLDNGLTWSKPQNILPDRVGENGYPAFLADSAGQLRAFVSARYLRGGPTPSFGPKSEPMHALWQLDWRGADWSPPYRLFGGWPADGFDPSQPTAVTFGGNKVLLAWVTDRGLKQNGISYAVGTLGLPAAAPEIYPTPTPIIPGATFTPADLGSIFAPTPQPTFAIGGPYSVPVGAMTWPLWFGLLPVLVLLISIVALRARHRK